MQGSGSGGFGFVINLGTLAVIGLVVVVVLALVAWRVFRP